MSDCRPAPTAPRVRLFSEELGVVLQVRAAQLEAVRTILARNGLGDLTHALGAPTREMRVRIEAATGRIDEKWEDLRRAWSETSFRMRELRDEPGCAREEFAAACDSGAPGLNVALTFDPERRHLGALHRQITAEGGGAARAGREQPGGNGRGAGARGLRVA